MSTWTEGELRTVAAATALRISTWRRDGTLRPLVPIWVVRAGDDLYVRSHKGSGGEWFRRVSAMGTAHTHAANTPRGR